MQGISVYSFYMLQLYSLICSGNFLVVSSAPPHWWWTWASGLLLGLQLQLGTYSMGFWFFFFSRLFCPLRFQNSPQTQLWEGFLLCGNFSSFKIPSPGQVSVPNSFVSLFVLYILSLLLSKRMGCLSGRLVCSASIQKLFCKSCSAFKWSFDEFVGEKVVSPSYSSTILALPQNLSNLKKNYETRGITLSNIKLLQRYTKIIY